MDKKFLGKLFDALEESQNKRGKSYFEFFNSISSLSIALIGLLIGLKPTPIPNHFAKIAFFIAIILIGLCTLFSFATRFYEVVFHNKEVEIRKFHIQSYIENSTENNLQETLIERPKIYTFYERATFFCLILAIFSLISYVYFLEF